MENYIMPAKSYTDLHIRGPKSEVVPQQLHDESAVLVRLLAKCIEFSNSFLKSLTEKEYKNHSNLRNQRMLSFMPSETIYYTYSYIEPRKTEFLIHRIVQRNR